MNFEIIFNVSYSIVVVVALGAYFVSLPSVKAFLAKFSKKTKIIALSSVVILSLVFTFFSYIELSKQYAEEDAIVAAIGTFLVVICLFGIIVVLWGIVSATHFYYKSGGLKNAIVFFILLVGALILDQVDIFDSVADGAEKGDFGKVLSAHPVLLLIPAVVIIMLIFTRKKK